MRVVWTYRDYRNVPKYKDKVFRDCELLAYEELAVFGAGLATWQILAPECIRVFYGDKSMLTFLEEKKLLDRFDEVHEVDFEQEIDRKYPFIDFFAAPKLWALTQQKESFFLVDTELMLFKPVREWYKNNYVGVGYEPINPIHLSNWTQEDLAYFEKLKSLVKSEHVRFLRPDLMINAGLTSWFDPEVAKAVGLQALDLCNEICSVKLDWRYKWTFCEESIIPAILKEYSGCSIKLLPIMYKTVNVPFTEWSNPGVAKDQIFKHFIWWYKHHPRIPVAELDRVNKGIQVR